MFLTAVSVPSLYTPAPHSTHVVSNKDTLAGVALAYNMKLDELRRLNRLYGSSAIFPGQRLKVKKNIILNNIVDNMTTKASKSKKGNYYGSEMDGKVDPKISSGNKKKIRVNKSRYGDMLAPVDVIHMQDKNPGPEAGTDSKIRNESVISEKQRLVDGNENDKSNVISKYKKFFKIKFGKKNPQPNPLEDGARSPDSGIASAYVAKSLHKSSGKKKKVLRRSKGATDLARLSIDQRDVFKTRAQLVYHMNEVYVPGEITIAVGNLCFEPDLDNCFVQKFGCALLTVSLSLSDIIKCEELSSELRFDCNSDKERILSIEFRPVEHQLMLQTRSTIEFLIPKEKFNECFVLAKGVNASKSPLNYSMNNSIVAPSMGIFSPTALPNLLQHSNLISLDNARKLARFFPNRYRCSDWVRLFTSTTDGFSWRSLYSSIKNTVPTLLLFKDSNGFSFGAFVAHEWQKGPNFYGTGETFLFSLVPNFGVYKWTEKNAFFVTANDSHFAFGGCEYGLYLDDELCSGCSYRSDTFFNRCLASEEEFQCVAVEAWTLQSK